MYKIHIDLFSIFIITFFVKHQINILHVSPSFISIVFSFALASSVHTAHVSLIYFINYFKKITESFSLSTNIDNNINMCGKCEEYFIEKSVTVSKRAYDLKGLILRNCAVEASNHFYDTLEIPLNFNLTLIKFLFEF